MQHNLRWIIVAVVLVAVALIIIAWPLHKVVRAPQTSAVASTTVPVQNSTATSTASNTASSTAAVACATGNCFGLLANGETVARTAGAKFTLILPEEYNLGALTISPAGSLSKVATTVQAPPGNWAQTFETTAPGPSKILVLSSTQNLQPYVLNIQTLDTAHAWEDGMHILQKTDANQTINLTTGTTFAVDFGNNLSWSLSFYPARFIQKVSNGNTSQGIQGVFKAVSAGMTTLTAVGAPICTAGTACPQFRVTVPIYITISPSTF